ncbi:hypothetical protein Mal15_55700 [Stieleria maiorica]|uniref:Uncharacterized protein n=1 Tax=Stieleria maiorica TaxID=2795974 RepID=A0A5B9MJD6_9BACT|nr:hypothetical protein Mal15_55700 [Stieleria maiorica]
MAGRCKSSNLNARSVFARWLLAVYGNGTFLQLHPFKGIVGKSREMVLILAAMSTAFIFFARRFTAATGALRCFRLNRATTATLARKSRRDTSGTVLLKYVRQARLHCHDDDE